MRRLSPRWGLALLVILFIAAGVVYSVTVPLFEAPDEIWHFSFIRVLAKERVLPVQPAEGKDMWLREAAQPPLYHLLAAVLASVLGVRGMRGPAKPLPKADAAILATLVEAAKKNGAA